MEKVALTLPLEIRDVVTIKISGEYRLLPWPTPLKHLVVMCENPLVCRAKMR